MAIQTSQIRQSAGRMGHAQFLGAVLTGCAAAAPPQAPPPESSPAAAAPALRPPAPVGTATPVRSALSIFAVDIGQGDATVVLGPELNGRRRALVMDAGDRAPSGGKMVAGLLTQEGVATLDYVVLSHFDSDHLGGFVTISGSKSLLWKTDQCEPTQWFPKLAIFDQGTDTNQSQSSAEWLRCVPLIASANGASHTRVQGGSAIGQELDLGGGCKAIVVAGDGHVIDSSTRVADVDTPNERSIALLVNNTQGFDFLVTGDLIGKPSGAENARVEGALGRALKARGVDVEVLRTGHHGAANATDKGFVTDIAPEVAIISTGDNQKANYKHPRCVTYQSLKDAAVPLVLQTERGKTDCTGALPIEPVIVNGTIRIDVDGSNYSVTSYGATSPANGRATNQVKYACTNSGGCVVGTTPPAGATP